MALAGQPHSVCPFQPLHFNPEQVPSLLQLIFSTIWMLQCQGPNSTFRREHCMVEKGLPDYPGLAAIASSTLLRTHNLHRRLHGWAPRKRLDFLCKC